jgi:hypothetical protein
MDVYVTTIIFASLKGLVLRDSSKFNFSCIHNLLLRHNMENLYARWMILLQRERRFSLYPAGDVLLQRSIYCRICKIRRHQRQRRS